jgi:hypothetical protein
LWEGKVERVIPECEEVLGRRSGWSAEVARTAEYFRERRDGVSGLSEGGVSHRIKSSDDFGTHPQEGLDRQTDSIISGYQERF